MTVAIFGITSRVARELALLFAAEGHPLWISARDPDEVARIAEDLRIRTGVQVRSATFDALSPPDYHALAEDIASTTGSIHAALIAFGDMGPDPEDPGYLDRIIDVNYRAAAGLADALAQRMAATGGGSIAAIGSVAGDRGRQSNYAYGSAKGALALFLQGLRNKYHAAQVQVLTVKLGFLDSPMTWGLKTKIPIASPESAARAIYNGMKRGSHTLYYPRFWRGIMGIIRTIPEPIFKRLKL